MEEYADLVKQYQHRFNQQLPSFIIRAPGRVNLIGEHIDYEGYSVLPMAISKEIVIAVGACAGDNTLHIHNLQEQLYPSKALTSDPFQEIEEAMEWAKYFMAGYKGAWLINRDSQALSAPVEAGIGLNVLISGDIPQAAGLSSSSAFVVASTMATRAIAQQVTSKGSNEAWANATASFSPTETAELCRHAEQFVGTMGGGMDQAISCLAETGCARLISFNPLHSVRVTLPSKAVFVIANSMTKAEKSKAAHLQFNRRVVECMLATKVLAKKCTLQNWKTMTTLLEFQAAYTNLQATNVDLSEMEKVAADLLDQDTYTEEEIGRILGIATLRDAFNTPKSSITNVLEHATEYKLRQRAAHVYSEANRVLKFQEICQSRNGADDSERLELLGQLMNDSQRSCREDYECSCDELNALTSKCLELGAYGSRLTGAGWGGCTVSLVSEDKSDQFIQNLQQAYYRSTPNASIHVFSCKPATGANILQVKK